MKLNKSHRILFAWLLLLSVAPSNGQHFQSSGNNSSTCGFELFIPSSQITDQSQEIKQEIIQFCESMSLKKHRYKNEDDFWKHVYYKVHRKYLKKYQSPSTLDNVLVHGRYDCLSGTALYALIFEQLGANYRIVETNYHVYIELLVGDEIILIEATNPLSGFIADEVEVRDLQKSYSVDSYNTEWEKKDYYRSRQVLNKGITLKELAGLQFFNLAAEAYNDRDIVEALALQDKALSFYPSTRLKELMAVMLKTMESDPSFNLVLKQQYLSKYDHLRHTIIVAFQK